MHDRERGPKRSRQAFPQTPSPCASLSRERARRWDFQAISGAAGGPSLAGYGSVDDDSSRQLTSPTVRSPALSRTNSRQQRQHQHEDASSTMNVGSSLVHLLTDIVRSILIVTAAICMYATDWGECRTPHEGQACCRLPHKRTHADGSGGDLQTRRTSTGWPRCSSMRARC